MFAHLNPEPESAAVAFAWMAKEVSKRSKGELEIEFHGGTLLTKELEIINAVKSGNIAIGDPGGAAATVFPEMGVFLVPYLVTELRPGLQDVQRRDRRRASTSSFRTNTSSRSCASTITASAISGTTKRPIVEPKDLRGLKLRVQPAKVFADTINGLGGVAVPMAWGEVIPAAQQGVIDGADLPIVNILALKAYEVSKYCSMTYHNYGPTVNGHQSRRLERPHRGAAEAAARRFARRRRRGSAQLTESVDNLEKAKELLEPKGMTVNDRRCRGLPQDRAGQGLAGLPEAIPGALGRDRRRPKVLRRT